MIGSFSSFSKSQNGKARWPPGGDASKGDRGVELLRCGATARGADNRPKRWEMIYAIINDDVIGIQPIIGMLLGCYQLSSFGFNYQT